MGNPVEMEPFFTKFKHCLEYKLASHGCLSFRKYVEYVSDKYDMKALQQFAYTSTHKQEIEFDTNWLLKQIFYPRYEAFRNIHHSNPKYKKLLDLYRKIQNREFMTEQEKRLLFDACIHAEHNSGQIIGINIELLREAYEKGLTELSIDKVFGILTRNALEQKLRTIPQFNAIFIDFNNMKGLNNEYGYEHVNSLLFRLFDEFSFRKTDVVGRWFSGDEILIATQDHTSGILTRLQKRAKRLGLSFKHQTFDNCLSFDDLSQKISQIKVMPFTSEKMK